MNKILIRNVLILAVVMFSSACFAETALPAGFNGLHVSLPDGCKVVEIPNSQPHDVPYQQTTKCDATSFNGVGRVQAKVYRIVDGDTIHIYIGAQVYAVRMLGMDTPELHFLNKSQPVWGQKARDNLALMVSPGDSVEVEFDQVKCDRYGRILVHVWRNGINLNEQQVKAGLAVNYCIAPNLKYCDQFAADYHRAESTRLGMHADVCLVTPYVWRRGMEGTPMDKKVQNRVTGAMFAPSDYYQIPVGDRIFYPSQSTVAHAFDLQ